MLTYGHYTVLKEASLLQVLHIRIIDYFNYNRSSTNQLITIHDYNSAQMTRLL